MLATGELGILLARRKFCSLIGKTCTDENLPVLPLDRLDRCRRSYRRPSHGASDLHPSKNTIPIGVDEMENEPHYGARSH